MDVLSPTQTGAATPATTQTDNSASDLTTDFDMFLRLLTTQMRNQDPLNPADSTEYTAQLATFSGVEQQVQTNDLLREIQAAFTAMNMGQLSGWIGMEARADMPVNFTGQPTEIQAAPSNLADRAELIVRDLNGEIVANTPIVLGDDVFAWNGQGNDGLPLPEGTYTLSSQSWRGEEMLEERAVFVYGEIAEAQTLNGEVWVTMENGVSIPSDLVQALRQAG